MYEGLNELSERDYPSQKHIDTPRSPEEALIITIKNLTDDKHYNIPVINPDYKSTESKYTYCGRLKQNHYDETLILFASNIGKKVAMIYTLVEHGYPEYMERQVAAGFIVNAVKFPSPHHDYQIQRGITLMTKEFMITQGMQFDIPFLLPEAEITLKIHIKP